MNTPNCDQLIEANMGLVHHILKRYRRFLPSAEYEDLVQEGTIGLWTAATQYDPARGVQFSTFACACIEGRIRRYVRARFAKKRDIRKTRYIEAMISTNADGEPFTLLDKLVFEKGDVEASVEARMVFDTIADLPQEERLVIRQIVLGYAQREIAARMNVSQARVSRIKRQAVQTIRYATDCKEVVN